MSAAGGPRTGRVWIWWLDLLRLPTEHFGRAYQEDNHRRGSPIPSAGGPGPAPRGDVRGAG
jgi:hypothetical protein